MDILILREVFQQVSVLDRFLSGELPLPDVEADLVPGLFLTARAHDTSKPDYAYRNALDAAVDGWQTWKDVVVKTLAGLGNHFFDGAGGSAIHVRYERFAEWQHLLAEVSPLAIVSARPASAAWATATTRQPAPHSGICPSKYPFAVPLQRSTHGIRSTH